MSEVSPPRQNVPVFNPKYFVFLGANIGGEYLDANYLKFPVSQYARQTFNSGIFLANSSNITFTDGTTQSTAPTSSATPTISDVITAGNDAAGLEVDNIVLKDGTCFITPPNGDNSLKIATTAYCDNAVAGLAPDIQQVLTSGNDATGLSLLNVVLNSATCSSTPSTGDNSLKVATTAFVGTAVNNALSSANSTYTERLTGGAGLQTITIPTGCVKFDIIVVGTGGLAGLTSANPPSGGQPDYYLSAQGTGGGANVASRTGILIPRQGNRYNSVLTYNNKGTNGAGTEVILNGTQLAEVFGGLDAVGNTGGLANTTPSTTDTTWGTWFENIGNKGADGPFITAGVPPYAGQCGGGNFLGGVIGHPNDTAGNTSQLNQAGQGQTYSALTGPSYGFPSFQAAPINYGGCIITWYIQV
jgi:hypothetical protein